MANTTAHASATGRKLSPDEADRLAESFRPSWEASDGPAPEVKPEPQRAVAVQNVAEAPVEERRSSPRISEPPISAHSSQPRLPPARVIVDEPEDSVIIDRSIDIGLAANAASGANGAQGLGKTLPLSAAPATPPPVPARALAVVPAPKPLSKPPPPAVAQAAAHAPVFIDSGPAEEIDLPKKSKTGIFIGMGAAAVVLLGIGVTVIAGSSKGDTKKPDVAAAAPEAPKTENASAAQRPHPGAGVVGAAPAKAALVAKPQHTAPAKPTAEPKPVAAQPKAAAPVAAPKPAQTSAPAAAAPKPKPAKPAGGIVRDVPF